MKARPVAVAILVALIAATAAVTGTTPPTLTDGRTGLVWVADPQYAVTSGFAGDVVMRRSRALRMVAAMNAGRLPNYGRTDWRLPTQRELVRWMRRHGGGTPPPAASALVRTWPVVGAAILPGMSDVAVLATNSVRLEAQSRVTGDLVVNDASPGPTLAPPNELKLFASSRVEGDVKADSIRIDPLGVVTGSASFNGLSNAGTISGGTSTPLPLPVFSLLPVFQSSSPRADAADVIVAAGQTTSIGPGDYDQIEVGANGRLELAAGVYQVRDVKLLAGADLAFGGASDLRIVQRLELGSQAFLGPTAGSGASASEIIVYVGGINGTTGALAATPAAARIGAQSLVQANIYAPNGSLLLDAQSHSFGSFFARDVRLASQATVDLASFFVNHPPVATPTQASTNGTATITVTLRGSDPDADDLTFDIASGPAHGVLGPVVQDPPPVPPGDPDRPQGDPPRTEATVTYTPTGAGDVEDSFVFRVTDTAGASGTATVTINPPGSEDPPPPDPTTVVADDTADTTTTDRPVTLTLTAGAPAGVELTFAILPATGPASGELGPLVQGTETPRRSATVVYTPDTGFNGVDGFQFEACGVIASVTTCDSATATVQTSPPVVEPGDPGDIAPNQTHSTPQNEPVSITLGAVLAGSGQSSASGGLRFQIDEAVSLDPAEVAGNVADADDDGFGDNHNDNLAAGAPVFISAGVGQTGGPGSNGTVRIHIEWDITGLGPIASNTSAEVMLTTNRGSVDSLDTTFFAGPGGNGTLEDDDFESTLEQAGAEMPVVGLVGADGTFSFDVRDALNAAIAAGATHFTVQGRVEEGLASGRGLQIYSTANNPLNDGKGPALILTSPPPLPPITYTITSLPAHGVLKDQLGAQITAVPFTLDNALVTYTPNLGFQGSDTFGYEAAFFTIVDTGIVTIFVNFFDCETRAEGCDDGR